MALDISSLILNKKRTAGLSFSLKSLRFFRWAKYLFGIGFVF